MESLQYGCVVVASGDTWEVIGVGATEDGATYVHLSSTTRHVVQKNGRRPLQACGWLRGDVLSVNL